MRKQLVAVAGIVLLTVGLATGYQWYTEGKWFATVPEKDFRLSKLIADIRMSTERYLDIEQAKADGYVQISGNVPLEGYHFYKSGIAQFDYAHPSALLYIRANGQSQLVGLEYAVPGEAPPEESPFPGIRWRRWEAACRYADWQEVHARTPDVCPPEHPETKHAYVAWRPDLWVIHLWLFYPNPYGLFASLNPLLAPFDSRSIPPGGASTWDEWQYRAAYSTLNHNLSGWLLLPIGLAMLLAAWGRSRFPWVTLLWPALMLVLAAFVLYRSDPYAWPYGVKGFAESLAERKVFEHKLSGLIILVMGLVEWLRARKTLVHWLWGMIFPLLAIAGGTVLFFHVHPESNFNYLGRFNQPHVTEGITAIHTGVTYILSERKLVRGSWWAFIPPLLVLLMGVQLILYLE